MANRARFFVDVIVSKTPGNTLAICFYVFMRETASMSLGVGSGLIVCSLAPANIVLGDQPTGCLVNECASATETDDRTPTKRRDYLQI